MDVGNVSAVQSMRTAVSTHELLSRSAPHCGSTTLRHRQSDECLSTLVELKYCSCLILAIGSAIATAGFLRRIPQIVRGLPLPSMAQDEESSPLHGRRCPSRVLTLLGLSWLRRS